MTGDLSSNGADTAELSGALNGCIDRRKTTCDGQNATADVGGAGIVVSARECERAEFFRMGRM